MLGSRLGSSGPETGYGRLQDTEQSAKSVGSAPGPGEILALDIAIPRNTLDWLENLPESITQHLEKKLYYGHFFCYVFHQDYILKKGSDASRSKR